MHVKGSSVIFKDASKAIQPSAKGTNTVVSGKRTVVNNGVVVVGSDFDGGTIIGNNKNGNTVVNGTVVSENSIVIGDKVYEDDGRGIIITDGTNASIIIGDIKTARVFINGAEATPEQTKKVKDKIKAKQEKEKAELIRELQRELQELQH